MSALRAPSWAKVNLTLHVRGQRADGFHELESLVALIGLADGVTVSTRHDDQITIECSDLTVPADATNLAVRAAQLLRSHTGTRRGAHIQLEKRIPAGGGLGGGSSNAATVLQLLNDLWRLEISPAGLADLGARLGSDVPLFCRDWPLAIMRGRGELIEPVYARLRSGILLAVPPIHSPTAAVYQSFASEGRNIERPAPPELFSRVTRQAQIDPLIEPMIDGIELRKHLFNDLEPAAGRVTPALAEFADRLRAASGLPFCMSGSGAAFFCLVELSQREEVAERLRRAIPRCRVISTIVLN